ncbi:biotin-dependent carboxyltransferase family protein [Pontibacterium granulatum]|uniref:5-oxoprolinase subunit C family protein n=1 Tax=Pontibacterium granulatum TaxID=2036029 RepID=UPI00249B25C1|nr:biotin-dependent carboxyltransferase family protein [Pontibacterium granulatum]MDI3325812.1 biotin-dependent carboxyltransferase family protein [Pontibacterium granulatum]
MTHNANTEGFLVRQPGLMTLIQDAGRFGQHGIGLTCGGPLDAEAFGWANRLCGNDERATALEVSFGGLTLEAQTTTRLAVTGAEIPLSINGQEKELWRSHPVNAGDVIELGYATQGCRAYLAVAGGFDIPHSFGSAATVSRESIGGLNGGKLEPNDFLACAATSAKGCLALADKHRPTYGTEAHLRVILGYQKQAFSDLQIARFFNSEYTTTDRSDRMGYRLNGPEIKPAIDGILSEGICHGAIQVPADGQPIILLNDRQTIGGYPKLGSVLSLDTAKLCQLTPGATITFEAITIDDAHNLHLLAKHRTSVTEPEAC